MLAYVMMSLESIDKKIVKKFKVLEYLYFYLNFGKLHPF